MRAGRAAVSAVAFVAEHWRVFLPMLGSALTAGWGLWRGLRREPIDRMDAITRGAEATVTVSVQVVDMLKAQIDALQEDQEESRVQQALTHRELCLLRAEVAAERRETSALREWIEGIRRNWAIVRRQLDPPLPPYTISTEESS